MILYNQYKTLHLADPVAAPERGGGPKGRRGDPVGLHARDALYRKKSIFVTCQDLIRHALRARHLPLRGEGKGNVAAAKGLPLSRLRRQLPFQGRLLVILR